MSTDTRSLAELSRLDGKVAVITGAAQGIGFALATRFSEAGAIVVIADIDLVAAERAAAMLESGGGRASGTRIDVAKEEDHIRVAEETAATYGHLDIWVNNAGIFPTSLALDMAGAEWHRVMAINVDGPFFGARSAARIMVRSGSGVILNIGSTSGFRASADGRSHYVASKSAVVGLTKALAREFGPHGIRVLSIAPVATITPGATAVAESPDAVDKHFEAYSSVLPLRRVATADDIAIVGVFCVSDQAGYLTGVTIPVDGGFLAV
ncbi:3-oxoacyl-ACP reductase FabG [soil metagenome]